MIKFLISNKFWKKFDSAALSFYHEFIQKGSEKATREITRAVLKYINEKNLTNTTSVNHINDVWENIHKEYESLDPNNFFMEKIKLILNTEKYPNQDILIDNIITPESHKVNETIRFLKCRYFPVIPDSK